MTADSTTPYLPPVVDDPDTGGFFREAGKGRLVVRTCDDCGASLHLPRAHCYTCGSFATSWHEVSGTGRVYSWSVLEHQVNPVFETPLTVILVSLDDRPEVRLSGYLAGAPHLEAGMRVRVRFDDLGDGYALPGWDLEVGDTP